MTVPKCDDPTERMPTPDVELVAGRYRLLFPLGEGGHGVVWCAEDTLLGKHEVAVKRLSAIHGRDPLARAELEREARVAIALTHPRLVRLHTLELDEGQPALVMERLRGPTLGAVLAARGRLSPAEVRRIGEQVCEGLAHAHAEGIVHLDLKPSNLILSDLLPDATTSLIDANAQVKISDFGIARVLTDTTARLGEHTAEQAAGGTLPYMSPEVIQGGPIDHRADIYSLGCVLYHLLAGRRPFRRGDIIHQHLHAEPPPIEDCPVDLAETISRCMAKDPAARFADCHALASALRGEGGSRSRPLLLALVCGLSLIAGLSVGAWILAPRMMSAETGSGISSVSPRSAAVAAAPTVNDIPPGNAEQGAIEAGELIPVAPSVEEPADVPPATAETPPATQTGPTEVAAAPGPTTDDESVTSADESNDESGDQARQALSEFTEGLGRIGRQANRGLERIGERLNDRFGDEEK